MTKQILTKKDIEKDLFAYERSRVSGYRPIWIYSLFVLTLNTVGLGIFFKSIFLFVVAALFVGAAGFLIGASVRNKAERKKKIKQGKFHIGREVLTGTIEDNELTSGLGHRYAKHVRKLVFSYGSWTVPTICYEWSKDYRMSATGVLNTSVTGDEFFVVTYEGDGEVVAAYNTKFFDYKES